MQTINFKILMGAALVFTAIGAPRAGLAQGGFAGPGRYEITIVHSGKSLALDRNDKTSVIQLPPRNIDSQQWDAHPADPGFWILRNVMNGAALECEGRENGAPVRGMPFTQSPPQQWRIEPGANGAAVIVSRLGKTLDMVERSRDDGARLQAYEPNGGANQLFVFHRINTPPARPESFREEERNRRIDERFSGRYDENDHMWKLDGDGVCFYRGVRFEGKAFCVHAGEDMRQVPEDWLEVFRSVKFFGRVREVVVFHDPDYQGDRVRISHDVPDLEQYRSERGEPFQRTVRSLRVE